MSRSKKKTPVRTQHLSEKDDKKEWHGRFRSACTQAIHNEEEIPPIQELSNTRSMMKDWDIQCAPTFTHKRDYNPEMVKKAKARRKARKSKEPT